jgi:hypothetical protein
LSPLPAVRVQRRRVAVEAFTSAAMLDKPLPSESFPDALGAEKLMSSMEIAVVIPLTMSAT